MDFLITLELMGRWISRVVTSQVGQYTTKTPFIIKQAPLSNKAICWLNVGSNKSKAHYCLSRLYFGFKENEKALAKNGNILHGIYRLLFSVIISKEK